jgi:hypothetical protein
MKLSVPELLTHLQLKNRCVFPNDGSSGRCTSNGGEGHKWKDGGRRAGGDVTTEEGRPKEFRRRHVPPLIDTWRMDDVFRSAAHWRMFENVKVKGWYGGRRACGEIVRVVTVEEGRVK